jgi:hypothetical protein
LVSLFRSVLQGRVKAWQINRAKRAALGQFDQPAAEIQRADWGQSLADPLGFYLRCLHYFDSRLPVSLRQHRHYFTKARRGFGEDPFHVMWLLLFREFHPQACLEIGVYRGQIISLWAWLARLCSQPCEVHGISPFSSAGDSVSKYSRRVEYLADTLCHFDHFGLAHPALLKAYSTDPEAVALIRSRAWDVIYIDGNHDYAVARQDWDHCAAAVKTGGLIVLDDAGLSTSFRPPIFATGGHPGPSRLAEEIDRARFEEILQVGHNRVFQRRG